jgi:1-deoxy-D-xylulose-5-phosphate reductoisomerase
VVNAVVGAAGLAPSLAALEAGHRLALANKESLVMAGGLLRQARQRGGGELLPVDSEHSAIFHCLRGRSAREVERIVLTASGGPFRQRPVASLARVTPQEALNHPTWSMGRRITVDSATLFNKGMEVIEAAWLFDLPLERIAVWIHPQSVVHGLVEWDDGSLTAQLSQPDMRLPIQLALSYPESWGRAAPTCDLTRLGSLEFAAPDPERFPCLALARRAAALRGTAPAALNAADEELVAAFLDGRITFPAIAAGLAAILATQGEAPEPDLDAILSADREARRAARDFIAACPAAGSGG